KAVAAGDGNQDITLGQFARGHQLLVIGVDVDFTATALDDQHFRAGDQVALDRQVDVPCDLTTRRIHDIADLEIAVPWCEKSRLLGQTPVRSHQIRQHQAVSVDRFDHATTPSASSRHSTSLNARRKSSCWSKKVQARLLYVAS